MDSGACNYSPGAEEAGECTFLEDVARSLGAASVDDVDCSGCLVAVDCNATCGGSASLDECGVCGGDGLACASCSDSDACNYDSEYASADLVDDDACTYAVTNYDCFGACVAGFDCVGVCGGSAEVDDCGVCQGNDTCCRPSNDYDDADARMLVDNVWHLEPDLSNKTRDNPAPGVTRPAPVTVDDGWDEVPAPDTTTSTVTRDDSHNETWNATGAPAPDFDSAVVPSPSTSCEGHCNILVGLKNATCFCDDTCYIYEDCCEDKEDYCPFDHGMPIPSPANDSVVPSPNTNVSDVGPAPYNESWFWNETLPAPDATTSYPFNTTTGPAPSPLYFGKQGSCDGFCLQFFGSQGKNCHCDKNCKKYDDCCFDIKVCKGVTTTTTTTTTTIAGDSCEATDCNGTSWDMSCYCDENCRFNNDCCEDRDDYCGAWWWWWWWWWSSSS